MVDTAIIKPYAKMIIAVVAILMIVGILTFVSYNGQTGIENVIGAGADFTETDLSSYQDDAQMQNYSKLGQPEIEYSATVDITAGVEVDLESLFTGTGTNGSGVTFYIEDVTDSSGESILFASEEDRRKDIRLQSTDSFIFQTQGIYVVSVKAVDKNKRVSCTQCRVPVGK